VGFSGGVGERRSQREREYRDTRFFGGAWCLRIGSGGGSEQVTKVTGGRRQ
jgi:hypothetical protein